MVNNGGEEIKKKSDDIFKEGYVESCVESAASYDLMVQLGGEDIKKYSGNIFKEGYVESCVESAAYNLRVSGTDLIIDGKLYNKEHPYPESVIVLPPRKTSVLFSEEKLKMDGNICATPGITFSIKRLGLIDLFGPQIDPSFKGQFIAIVHNMTSKQIRICKGQPLIKVKFEPVGNILKNPPPQSHFEITDLIDITKMDSIQDLWIDIWKSKEFLKIQAKVDDVASGYRNVTLFGIFLISGTIFGVVFTILLQNSEKLTIVFHRELIEYLFIATIILFLISWVIVLIAFIKDLNKGDDKK